MPAPNLETPPPKINLEVKHPVLKPEFSKGTKPGSAEANLVAILEEPQVSPDQTLEALAKQSPTIPDASKWRGLPPPEGAAGIAARIGHLQMQLEKRGIPDDVRRKIEGQLAQLEADLKILAGEVKGLQTETDFSVPKSKQEKVEVKEENKYPQLKEAERDYLDTNKAKMEGLEARYVDERTNANYLEQQIEAFARASGLQHEEVTELAGKNFDADARKIIGERVQEHIDTLLNSENGRINPEKHRVVTEQTKRYLDLISQAQSEGDLPATLEAQTVLRLAEQNVWTLAFQDRVASENLLGDHGIRHIVGYNIQVSENIFDELVRNGQQVRAVDRLIMHQVMIDHDLGYAMDPVRQQINRGIFQADKGHNVLAAKYERQRAEDGSNPLHQIFSDEQLDIIHEGILYHDSSEVNFHIGDTSVTASRENIYSAIHTADNTHAFEDKLPELLYTYPETLRVMRLMKTAGEIGDQESFQRLQVQLVKAIQSNPNFSIDDKSALVQAAHSLTEKSYQFTIGRICGNKPECSMNNQGALTITVQESKIHQEVVGLYGQESYDQLRKFVGDLTGKSKNEVDLNQQHIESTNGKLEIKVKIGEQKAAEDRGDYQQRLEQLIQDHSFQEFIIGDGGNNPGDAKLEAHQASLQAELIAHTEETEMHTRINARLNEIKSQRRKNLHKYLARLT